MPHNIVILNGHGATQYYRAGWAKALAAGKHSVLFWDKTKVSAFDMFHDCKPTLLVIGTWELDEAILKCVREYKPEIMLWGPNYGIYDVEIDYKSHPIQRASKEEVVMVSRLCEIKDPKYIFSYYPQHWMNVTHNNWTNTCGLEPIGYILASDIFDYSLGQVKPEFECDIAFVGGWWPYKAANMLPYFSKLVKKFHVKIFGYGNWPFPQHCGTIDTTHVRHIFRSAKCCINLFEPFATEEKYAFDMNERTYKVLSAGGILCSQTQPETKKLFNNYCDFFNTPEEAVDCIEKLVSKEEGELDERRIKGSQLVYKHHTYLNRAAHYFELIGDLESRNNVVDLHTSILRQANINDFSII